MRRLYFIADDIDTTERVSDAIHAEGISDHHFHVVSRDEAGLYTHRIQSATPYQQLDVIHTGERFALIGAIAATLLALTVLLAEPLGYAPPLPVVLAIIALGGCFGAWIGGMVGLSRENYKLAPFHDDISAGRYLIMVDLRAERLPEVRDLMRSRFPGVREGGEDTTLINPLVTPDRVYHQNTH